MDTEIVSVINQAESALIKLRTFVAEHQARINELNQENEDLHLGGSEREDNDLEIASREGQIKGAKIALRILFNIPIPL